MRSRTELVGRSAEWGALERFVGRGPGFGIVSGPRRAGKSFLLDHLVSATGGWRYQAIGGTERAQLDDFGSELGARLGAGPLALASWSDALSRIDALGDAPVVLDEYPSMREASPGLDGVLQRVVDGNRRGPLIICGSAMSTMRSLVEPQAPLYGRASLVLVPPMLDGGDLRRLWGEPTPERALWIDAALGGLPGYRPLVDPPRSLDRWMVDQVLAPSSPLLDAAEATLTAGPDAITGVLARSVIAAIASGEHTFAGIGRRTGTPATALSRPLRDLERAGVVGRIPDPLRSRRDRFDLANPHLRFWLALVAPHRSHLQAGRAEQVWSSVRDTTWPSRVLGPRWESAVRSHVEHTWRGDGPLAVGVTQVSDPKRRGQHELDLVAVADGRVVAIGESKLRRLGVADLDRLRHLRTLLDAPDASLILASASGFERTLTGVDGIVRITPADLYP